MRRADGVSTLKIIALMVVWMPLGGLAFGGFLIALPPLPPDASLVQASLHGLAIVLVLIVVAAPYIALVLAIQRSQVRRFVRGYLAAPRCLKCKYPVPPPREGRSYSICPECGEPIPPEIATLAAERAER